MKTFDELKHEISILELAAANGYALDKKAGCKYPLLRHPSGDKVIIIDAAKTTQGYFNPNDDRDKGSLINFVRNRLGWIFSKDGRTSDLANVSKVLHDYLNIPFELRNSYQKPAAYVKEMIEAQKAIGLNVKGLKPLTDISYLQSRCISTETIDSGLFMGRIFNHPSPAFKNNIGFIYTDEDDKITGVEVCNSGFKKFMPGSDRAASVWHSNMPERLEYVLFFESPIDALSYYDLERNDKALYVAFGGQLAEGQLQTAKHFIDRTTIGKEAMMFSCFDNDKAGERFTVKLKEYFTIDEWIRPESGKDFNEWLQGCRTNTQSTKNNYTLHL